MLNSFLDKFIFTNALRYTHYNFYLLNVGFSLVPVNILAGLAMIDNPETNRQLYVSVKQQVSASLLQSFQLGLPVESALVFLEEFFTAAGWGLMKHVDVDAKEKRAIIVVDENPIARALQGKAHKPVDHLFRGVLAGVFSHLFQTDIDCVEHQCMALGQQHCEFILKQQPDFDFSKQEPREQLVLNV